MCLFGRKVGFKVLVRLLVPHQWLCFPRRLPRGFGVTVTPSVSDWMALWRLFPHPDREVNVLIALVASIIFVETRKHPTERVSETKLREQNSNLFLTANTEADRNHDEDDDHCNAGYITKEGSDGSKGVLKERTYWIYDRGKNAPILSAI